MHEFNNAGLPFVEQVLARYSRWRASKTSLGRIPRMVKELFARILESCSVKGLEYMLRVLFVETNNKKLAQDPARSTAPSPAALPAEVLDLLHAGHVNRSVASHSMKRNSSWSHAVFMLQLESPNTETGWPIRRSRWCRTWPAWRRCARCRGVGADAQGGTGHLHGLVINPLVEGKTHVPGATQWQQIDAAAVGPAGLQLRTRRWTTGLSVKVVMETMDS